MKYRCGCETLGDLISPRCPFHGELLLMPFPLPDNKNVEFLETELERVKALLKDQYELTDLQRQLLKDCMSAELVAAQEEIAELKTALEKALQGKEYWRQRWDHATKVLDKTCQDVLVLQAELNRARSP